MASTSSHWPGDRVATPVEAEDRAAGGEVRPADDVAQLVIGQIRVIDQRDGRVSHLTKVMRRDVRRHSDGNPRRAVDKQVGELGREHGGLHARAVVVLDEIDGLLVDIGQDLGRDRRHPRLGVPHGGRRVAVDRAEVALTVDERIAQ